MLGAPAYGTALPHLRGNPMRAVAGARRLDRGLPTQSLYLRLLQHYHPGKPVRRARFTFPAATSAASQTAIGCQTCPERHDYYRSDRELDLSARSPLTAAALRRQK